MKVFDDVFGEQVEVLREECVTRGCLARQERDLAMWLAERLVQGCLCNQRTVPGISLGVLVSVVFSRPTARQEAMAAAIQRL